MRLNPCGNKTFFVEYKNMCITQFGYKLVMVKKDMNKFWCLNVLLEAIVGFFWGKGIGAT